MAAQQADAPWPQLGRDRHRSGQTPINGPVQPTQKWAYDAGGKVIAGPVIAADGTVYIGVDSGHVHAVRSDGTRAWRYAVTFTQPDGTETTAKRLTTPAIDERGLVIFGADDGKVRALKPDGSLSWTFDTADPRGTGQPTQDATPVLGAPLLATGLGIVVGADDDRAYSLWPDGTLRVWHNASASVRAAPAQGPDGAVVFADLGGRLHSTGQAEAQRWVAVLDGAIEGGAVIGRDGIAYVGTAAGSVYAISPERGDTRWKRSVGSAVRAPVALSPDGATVYAGSDDGKLHALATTDGTERWSHQTGGAIRVQPTVGGNGTIYLPSGDGHLYVLAPDGARLSTFRTDGGLVAAAALAADGTLYLGSQDGRLYALKEGAAPTAIPAPAATATLAPAAPPMPPPPTPTPVPSLPTARVEPLGGPDTLYFPETGHNLRAGFLAFFREHGGVEIFGYPRTEEFVENGVTVQYFQRARFEYHPENVGTPFEIQLGLLGDELLRSRGALP